MWNYFRSWDSRLLPFAQYLKSSALITILEQSSRLAVVVAIVSFFLHLGEARRAKEFQAWQAINTAEGKGGDGGRAEALKDLLDDGVSLAGVNLTGANLRWLVLRHADLSGAYLQHGIYTASALPGAYLVGAHLDCPYDQECGPSPVDMWDADLHYANLERVSAFGANFGCADLRSAILREADLTNTYFGYANLAGADLTGATLKGACLQGADLTGAMITDAQLASARGAGVIAPGHAVALAPCDLSHPKPCQTTREKTCAWWEGLWCKG